MENYLVVDLEATCCDRRTFPKTEMEIIEIGAVMVSASTLKPVDEFQTFVRPVRHPALTEFCTELTSIRQADVDSAPGFLEAMASFRRWFERYGQTVFCSWGDYDRNQFTQDAGFHEIDYPMPEQHINLKRAFSEANDIKKRFSMAWALKHVGLTLEGIHHRGIDDARNIARLLPRCGLTPSA